MAAAEPPRLPLTRDRILDAALALADEHGLAAVTMRRVAQSLGFEAMSLYNHVANKDDLLDALVERIVSEIELADGDDWRAAVRACALSAHASLRAHPWACALVMSPRVHSGRVHYMNWLLGRLGAAGFAPELTYHAYHVLDAHILGFTMWEAGHSYDPADIEELTATFVPRLRLEYPHLADHAEQHLSPPGDVTGFEFGLELILDGLERLRRG